MKQLALRPIIIVLLMPVLISGLVGCNMPISSTPTQSGIDLIATYAAQTVQAQLTEVSKPPATSAATTTIATASPSGGATATPQGTTTPGSTSEPSSTCNLARFVEDVTIPDDTQFIPGSAFTKTWRLRNAGTCSWTSQYSIFFFRGDQMNAPDSAPLTVQVIAPGETVDVSVNMVAPNTGGNYRGEWKLRAPNGETFGIGNNANPIWVEIQVVTDSGLDFISQASSAEWKSGAPNQTTVDLPFNGARDDPNGAARIEDRIELEDGRISGKVLLTYPKRQNNGWISGTYQPYVIQSGDHFEARLTFAKNPDGACGAGQVRFELRYREGDSVSTLGTWEKTCNGSPIAVDLDLSRLEGKTVRFILTVYADGVTQDDWAIWNSAQITN